MYTRAHDADMHDKDGCNYHEDICVVDGRLPLIAKYLKENGNTPMIPFSVIFEQAVLFVEVHGARCDDGGGDRRYE